MARIIVTTEDGRRVYRSERIVTRLLMQVGHAASLVAMVRRAAEDADAIEAGRDPERPSEKAMRLATEEER